MNNMRVWKVIALNTFTFGLYSLKWFADQQQSIEHKYKGSYPMPSWVWLMVVVIAGSITSIAVPFIIFISLFVSDMPAEQVVLLSYLSSIAVIFVSLVVSSWWVFRFGVAMEGITKGRVTRLWSLLLFLAIGPYITAVYQYYINRLERYGKAHVRPSRKFVRASWVLVVTALVFTVISFAMNDLTPVADSVREGRVRNREYLQRIDGLTARYDTCIKELDERYPGDLTLENEDEYRVDYNKCEAIRLEQQRVIDSY